VRASEAPDISPLLAQLKVLQEENAMLKGATGVLGQAKSDFTWTTEGRAPDENFHDQLQLGFGARQSGNMSPVRNAWKGTYLQIFILLASKLIEEPLENAMPVYVNKVITEQFSGLDLYRVSVLDRDYQNMKMKLVALNLIALTKIDGELHWALTNNGKSVMMQHHAGLN
jgi:hypothetical protein